MIAISEINLTDFNQISESKKIYTQNDIDDNFENFDCVDNETIKCIIIDNKLNNYSNLLKYIQKGINEDKNICIENIGLYYEFIEKKPEVSIDYYLKYYNLTGETTTIRNIAEYYENNYEYELMYKYLQIGIDKLNTKCILKMGDLCFDDDKNHEALKFLNLAEELGDTEAYYYLCLHHINAVDEIDKSMNYAKKSIKSNDYRSIKYIWNYFYENKKKLVKNPVKLYNFLMDLDSENDIVLKKINKLEKNPIIKRYIDVLSLITINPNIKKCMVCYDDNSHIAFNCEHEICIKCYANMNNCYYKCKNSVWDEEDEIYNDNSDDDNEKNKNDV